MSSSLRRIVINTLEQAVSSDLNRMQLFQGKNIAELQRALIDTRMSADDPATNVENFSPTAPATAEIVSGLMVRPQAGSFSLLVDGGTIGIVTGAPTNDESGFELVVGDPGVPAPGTLAIGANVSGSVRIDVVECRINPIQAIVTDSRNIFDSASGLFTAQAVTKETKAQLEFRVRAGVPGSGLPSPATGWLPLMVARIPNGAASNDVCTFWDVRNLVSDRSLGPMSIDAHATILEDDFKVERVSASDVRLTGRVGATFRGRRVGGELRRGTPGSESAFLEVAAASNGGAAEPVTALQHLFLTFPGGLPRWARYTDGPVGRVPRAPCGIPVVSTVAPTETLAPSSPIPLPPGLDLGPSVATTDAIAVSTIGFTAATTYAPAHARARRIHYGIPNIVVSGTYSAPNVDFAVPETAWPANARAALLSFSFDITIAATGTFRVAPSVVAYADNAGSASLRSNTVIGTLSHYNSSGGAAVVSMTAGSVWIPRPVGATNPFRVTLVLINALTIANMTLLISGYEFS